MSGIQERMTSGAQTSVSPDAPQSMQRTILSEELTDENKKILEQLTFPFTHVVARPVGLQCNGSLNLYDVLDETNPKKLENGHLLLQSHSIFLPHSTVQLAEVLNASTTENTSACIVAPIGLSGLVRQHHPMAREIHTFTANTVICDRHPTPEQNGTTHSEHLDTVMSTRVPSTPLKHTVCVFYVPAKTPTVCALYHGPVVRCLPDFEPARKRNKDFYFSHPGKVHNMPCSVLFDSGCAMLNEAYAGVIDSKLVKQLGIPLNKVGLDMKCDGFNGSTSIGLGSVTTTIKLRNCVTVPLTFLVVELGKAHDIILGQESMKRLHVVLDFAGESIMLRDSGNKQHTLSNATLTTKPSRSQCARISLKKTRKIADANSFICFVRTSDALPEIDPRLEEIIHRYETVFQPLPDGEAHMRADDPGFRIKTVPGSVPPSRAPYRAFGANRVCVEKEIDKLLKSGKIKPSNSPYGAPVIFVTKPDGTLRFCIDY